MKKQLDLLITGLIPEENVLVKKLTAMCKAYLQVRLMVYDDNAIAMKLPETALKASAAGGNTLFSPDALPSKKADEFPAWMQYMGADADKAIIVFYSKTRNEYVEDMGRALALYNENKETIQYRQIAV